MTTILHISDLHFGDKFRFSKKEYPGIPEEDIPELEELLKKDIFDNLNKKPDLVIVSGDLTWTADAIEFDDCKDFLIALSEKLKVPRENFVIIPGNHDIPWHKKKEGLTKDKLFTSYNNFFKDFFGKEPTDTLYQLYCDDKVSVLGLNSALLETKEEAGVGYIGKTQLDSAIKEMEIHKNYNPDAIKIAVLHHHLVPVVYLDFPKETNSYSITRDAEEIIETLLRKGFSMVLHGHQHQPFVASESRIAKGFTVGTQLTGKEALIIFGAGSIGVLREHLGVISRNQYFLLEVDVPNIKITSRITYENDQSKFMDHYSQKLELPAYATSDKPLAKFLGIENSDQEIPMIMPVFRGKEDPERDEFWYKGRKFATADSLASSYIMTLINGFHDLRKIRIVSTAETEVFETAKTIFLFGSISNNITKSYLEENKGRYVFEFVEEDHWTIIDTEIDKRYTVPDLRCIPEEEYRNINDYGILRKIISDDRTIFIIAGLGSTATRACSYCLLKEWQKLYSEYKTDPFEKLIIVPKARGLFAYKMI